VAETIKAFGMSRAFNALAAVLALILIALTPLAALAQATSAGSSAAASGAPASASAAAANSPAASVSAPAAASAQPAAAGASAGASTAPAGVATPVGSNPPKETPESLSLLAYLLIVLAGIWFLAAIAGIIRLLMRPTRGPYAVPLAPSEQDRHFLSFVMPFGALITVAIIVVVFGTSFLQLSHISDIYPLAVDLAVVCLVMLIATVAAMRGGSQHSSAVH